MSGLVHTLVLRSSPLDSLAQTAAGSSRLLFRLFLMLKIASPFVFSRGVNSSALGLPFLLLILLMVAGWSRYYLAGLLATLALSAYEGLRSWPFTINHGGLEFVALALLSLQALQVRTDEQDVSAEAMIRVAMLSVWFYSGVHKIFDGYYLNGEFFALEFAKGETTLGIHLGEFLALVAQGLGLPVSTPALACCTTAPVQLFAWEVTFLTGLSWLTIATELALPLSMFFARTRFIGLLSLVIFQGFIGFFSGEIDFAFTAFGILLLFVPQVAWLGYPLLAGLYLWVQPWA